ncbi:protein DMP3-like [Ziziphus jujuba]|uniref:Protein DMP3-like n=1 Tax=Ziziphus jujuba TaxID=326968 RepID=A0A6P3ZCV4_ZIZJJ|nr:protein DMP3-like [Ziziphus jujuba]
MALRPTKVASINAAAAAAAEASESDSDTTSSKILVSSSSSSAVPSISQRAISQTLNSTANLANLLPTGTLLAFQLLTPTFTSNGVCDSATRLMTSILLILLALSCFLASFTDSVKASDGRVYYGFATSRGLWLFDSPDPAASGLPDLTKFKVRFMDWVHAVLSVLVFVAVALRDRNIVGCFYPMPRHETQEVLNILPVGIGLLSSLLFVVFPTTRHGIGYPLTSTSTSAPASSAQ